MTEGVTIRHAREALAKAESDDIATMTQLQMAERHGELVANLRMLLSLVDDGDAGNDTPRGRDVQT